MSLLPFRSKITVLSALLLSVLSAVNCVAQAEIPDDAKVQELYSQAQASQQRGDYASAARAYEQLAKLRPDLGEIWANAGLMRQFMTDYLQADRDFQLALTKNARLYVPNLFLGLNRLRLHQPQGALPYLKRAVALNGEDEQAALALGKAYAGVRDYGNAAREFERARRLNAQDPDAWYELGVTYLNIQASAAAQLKQLDAEEVHARILVAEAFVEQGRVKDAIQIYEKLGSQPRPPCLPSELGFAYVQAGSIEQGRRAFEQDSAGHPGCLLATLGLARIALAKGDFAGMLHQLHEVDDREPRFLQLFLQRIWAGMDGDQLQSVVTELQKPAWAQDAIAPRVIESAKSGVATSDLDLNSTGKVDASPAGIQKENPEQLWSEGHYSACAEKIQNLNARYSASLRGLLEQCSFYAGDYRLALETSRRALQTSSHDFDSLYWQAKSAQELAASSFAIMNAIAPNSPKVHLLMAELHRTREEYAAAEQEYKEVLKSRSSDVEALSAHLGLADIYFHQFEDDRAVGELQSVLKADSSDADANSLLGQLLVRRHQFDDAIPHLRLALQGVSPDSAAELHSVLAKCYAARGENAEALQELKPALTADTMGTYHYQLYQLYLKLGDQKAAANALVESENLRRNKSVAEQEKVLREQ
jgi:tetratricopeptide (TPR) repeat protein